MNKIVIVVAIVVVIVVIVVTVTLLLKKREPGEEEPGDTTYLTVQNGTDRAVTITVTRDGSTTPLFSRSYPGYHSDVIPIDVGSYSARIEIHDVRTYTVSFGGNNPVITVEE